VDKPRTAPRSLGAARKCDNSIVGGLACELEAAKQNRNDCFVAMMSNAANQRIDAAGSQLWGMRGQPLSSPSNTRNDAVSSGQFTRSKC